MPDLLFLMRLTTVLKPATVALNRLIVAFHPKFWNAEKSSCRRIFAEK